MRVTYEPGPDTEARFRALAEASPAAIFIAQRGRIVYANPALAAVTEFDRADLIGTDPRDLLHPSELDAAAARQASRDRGEPVESRYEVRIRTRTGQERWIDLTTVPFVYAGSTGVVGTGIDITDRKYLEERMQQRQQLEAVGRLAGGVAHDFNNLLLVISGEAERLIEGLHSHDPLRASAEAVAQSAARAAALTQHLLAFGRQQTLIARPVDISDVVRELGPTLWEGLGERITPGTRLTPNLPVVRVDRTRLEQAILSLVANASEAMEGAGSITITTDFVETDSAMRHGRPWLPAGHWVRLQLVDTGPGIPPDVLPRVFEPFFTTKRAGAGSGLGLSTVYGIVKQSGGYVWIDSPPGAGASVTILLPPAEAASPPAPRQAVEAATRPHVLLVEDQDGVRELLTTVLQKNGFEVSTAPTAERALEMAPDLHFDLLLTDVVLPGMTGPELARQLRTYAPRVRVLFMSGYTGDALQDEADFGDGAFIQKPFASKALLERIRSLLDFPPGDAGFSTFVAGQ
ncbi:MAG: ATP-binding protein [Vicinamibacterales bacterium]